MLLKQFKNYLHFFYSLYGAVRFRFPSEELLVIGVTGTSGKSSVIYFLKQVLEYAGFKVGALSTIEFCVAGKCGLNDKKMTMLGRTFIQQKLREMVDIGCQVALIETTSEGYLQHRQRFINYDIIVLTNLYPEHIEAHGGFENYKRAKLGIFEYVSDCRRKTVIARPKAEAIPIKKGIATPRRNVGARDDILKTAIVNGRSEYGEEFLQYDFDRKIRYQIADNSYQISKEGLRFEFERVSYFAPLYGKHNIENLAAVIAVAKSLNISQEKIKSVIAQIKPPPGRIEFIKEAEKFAFQVIVDYAFEPIALQKLYEAIELLDIKGKIIHVCGSTGGGRDKDRRPKIGKLVGEKANMVIVTNEDPYDEDPLKIIKQVSAGAQSAGKKSGENLFEILDRGEAIKKAVEIARAGDLILITGKGSEQAIAGPNGELVPWDDRVAVKRSITL